jgi:hypothetical protein
LRKPNNRLPGKAHVKVGFSVFIANSGLKSNLTFQKPR